MLLPFELCHLSLYASIRNAARIGDISINFLTKHNSFLKVGRRSLIILPMKAASSNDIFPICNSHVNYTTGRKYSNIFVFAAE